MTQNAKKFTTGIYFFVQLWYNRGVTPNVLGKKPPEEVVLMNDYKNDINVEYLYRALMMAQNIEECRNFMEDLCTISELQEMARRLQAARMLKKNYVYSEIAEQTGLSTATISRVNRCLKYGSDGYLRILERLEKAERR